MNASLIVIVLLVFLLLIVSFLAVKMYSSSHKKLEFEREEHDKYERLYKFMGRWMEAEEQGNLIADKIRCLNSDIVILGKNPIAKVLGSKLDRANISYRSETEVEACGDAGIVLVADISKYEKLQKKLEKIGVNSVSVEDVFYEDKQ